MSFINPGRRNAFWWIFYAVHLLYKPPVCFYLMYVFFFARWVVVVFKNHEHPINRCMRSREKALPNFVIYILYTSIMYHPITFNVRYYYYYDYKYCKSKKSYRCCVVTSRYCYSLNNSRKSNLHTSVCACVCLLFPYTIFALHKRIVVY